MILDLEIENFKCFKNLRLPFSKLTLFTGYNGAGKSSAIQPLLLLSQGLRSDTSAAFFPLNGPLVSLGTAADVIRTDPDATAPNPAFSIGTDAGHINWNFVTRSAARSLYVDPASETQPQPVLLDAITQLKQLCYLSAVRQGTSEVYPTPDVAEEAAPDMGADGHFAAFWYDQTVDDEVVEGRRHPGEPATSLRKQFDAWFASLFPGARANVQKLQPVAQLCLQFQLSETGEWRRPANVGYGLSYVFPILVALLVAQEGQMIVVDSPEAHLHPFAQSQMGRLLAHFAAAGVQILVETHSDHLLNGIRLAVKDGVIAHNDVKIHFFTGASAETHGVISPLLDSTGSVSEWPEGFFDQADKDLSRLTGWN